MLGPITTLEGVILGVRVQFFVATMADLRAGIPGAIHATRPGGALWVCSPKKASGVGDLSRETVWERVKPTVWRLVTQIALDELWSVVRFRPEVDIKRAGTLGR